MTLMHMDAMTALAAANFEVTLTTSTIFHVGGFSSSGGFNFTNGGYVQQHIAGCEFNVNTSTDWIIPRSSPSPVYADWQVRGTFTSIFDSQTPSTAGSTAFIPYVINTPGSWYDLDSTNQYEWTINTGFDNEFATLAIRYEIRNQTVSGYNTLISTFDAAPIAATAPFTVSLECGLE